MTALWLAIDTATDVASVAVGSAEHIAAVRSIRGARQHAAQIVPLIQQVLAVAKLRLGQVTGIIVGDGPGSFTGLRIGLATAWSFGRALGIAVESVSTLEAIAEASRSSGRARLQAVLDAGRGEVIVEEFSLEGSGTRADSRGKALLSRES